MINSENLNQILKEQGTIMNGKVKFGLLSCIWILLTSGFLSAETTFGKNYVEGSLSFINFGDGEMSEIFGNANEISGKINFNITSHFDLSLGAGYFWAEGSDQGFNLDLSSTSISLILNYFFNNGNQFVPYFRSGIIFLSSELKATGFGGSETVEESDFGLLVGFGFGYSITENVYLNLGLDYYTVNDEDGLQFAAQIGFWFNESIIGTFGGSLDLDNDSSAVSVGVIISF